MTGNFFSRATNRNDGRILIFFMVGWLIINLIQAAFIGVDKDEAYYWYLSQHLDWGYFDHPPMVALLIRIGESLAHGPLFTRLGTILVSTLTIPAIYAALPDHLRKVKNYLWLFAAVLLFNVYGFITTPDAPLLFFTALFFAGYKSFLEKDKWPAVLLMSLAITGMFYSKYHGILPVLLVVLSNPRLLITRAFWIMVLIVTLLFLPHIYWQYQHDWPTVRYHLVERVSGAYQLSYTTDYLLGQLLVWGPIISLPFYYGLFKITIKGKLMRAHFFTFIGVLLFFLISSFKNGPEPHWTLIAGVSFVVLFMELINQGSPRFRKVIMTLCKINIGLILLARILFLIPGSPFEKVVNYRAFYHSKDWAAKVWQAAENKPVLFSDSYANPSLYTYYHTGAPATAYNTKNYRKTNFSLTGDDCAFNGQTVWYYRSHENPTSSNEIAIRSDYENGVLIPVSNYTCVNGIRIRASHMPHAMKAGETKKLELEISNEGGVPVYTRALRLDYAFITAKFESANSKDRFLLPDTVMAPGYRRKITIPFTAPTAPGHYPTLFSIVNGIIPGNFASPFYKLQVN